jgi:hypothetical protein
MTMNYEEHLKNLRKLYYESFPEQRLHVGEQRIENPDHRLNQIVTYVSAIERLLRSLVLWDETATEKTSQKKYEKYEHYGFKKLFSIYLEQRSTQSKDIISDDIYRLVEYAVKYRSLILAHECTNLGQDKYHELIDACEAFLHELANHAGIKDP